MRAGTPLRLAAALLILPSSVAASDIVYIGTPTPPSMPYDEGVWEDAFTSTHVQIRPTEMPDALAEIYYQNAPINDSDWDDGVYRIEWNGIEVEVHFDHDYNMETGDLATIVPPDGIACRPMCDMLLDEHDSMVIYLVSGVGF